ncbi:MAG TPA: FtsK/SpoIIIE domain-containing protein [Chloroflexia bacterium]|nr:FtsK/SpoIIIE domain-containing protein [Chloroflexia bacterium]
MTTPNQATTDEIMEITNGRETFNRPPRIQPPDLSGQLNIPDPPEPRFKGGKLGWALVIVPLVVILLSLAASITVTLLGNSNAMYLLVIVVAMIGAFVTGVINIVRDINNDKVEQRNYLEVLEKRNTTLRNHTELQRSTQQYLYPDLQELQLWVAQRSTRLWERRPTDPDFLTLRLGTGSQPNSMLITAPNPDRKVPNLDKALEISAAYKLVRDIPNVTELGKIAFLGVCGAYSQTIPFTRALICHLAAHHSPDEVKVMAVYAPTREDEWAWLGWLPHCRLEGHREHEIPLVASQTDQFEWLMKFLEDEIKQRSLRLESAAGRYSSGQAANFLPRYLLIVDDFELVRHEKALNELFKAGEKVGIYLISISSRLALLPEQGRARVEMLANGLLRYSVTGTSGYVGESTPDLANLSYCENLALNLTSLKPAIPLALGQKTDSIRLLEMLGVDLKAGQNFDPLPWWQRSSLARLSVPVGRLFGGQEMLLDFTEKGHGPHGLVAGTTGSGKSELLMTIVSALALANSPDNVNFVLADFKGGATFKPFEKLPHTVGLFSDLNLFTVERMMNALIAEKNRREKLLEGAGVSHIRDYHRKKPQPAEPMPYLFIVIDEFAEMKDQIPDLINNLVIIARTGRTLGMHLILATQRPAGVIPDQLKSNIRFRICLRVESPEDSIEMLERRDAADIPASAPGRAYFRVGREFYELFQVARVAEDYIPPEQLQETPDEQEILIVETSWRTMPLVPGRNSQPQRSEEESELAKFKDYDLIVQQCGLAAHRLVLRNNHRPCLDALLPVYHLPQLLGSSAMFNPQQGLWPKQAPFGYGATLLGLEDNVSEQAQRPWKISLAQQGSYCVSGAPGSGRTTFLRSLVAGLALTHRPDLLHFYYFDFANSLEVFENLPHTARYLSTLNLARMKPTMRLLVEELDRRQAIFNSKQVADIWTYHNRRSQQDEVLPLIVVMITSFSAYRSELPFDAEQLKKLVGEGRRRGIHVVLAVDSYIDYESGRRADQFYHVVLRQTLDHLPFSINKSRVGVWAGTPGRGFVMTQDSTKPALEIQVALPAAEEPDRQLPALEQLVKQMRQAVSANYSHLAAAKAALEQENLPGNIGESVPVPAQPAKEELSPGPEPDWEEIANRQMEQMLADLKATGYIPPEIAEVLDLGDSSTAETIVPGRTRPDSSNNHKNGRRASSGIRI